MSRKIFVFGSNWAGIHGKGAALTALKQYGATLYKGRGIQGDSYAIPTKDSHLKSLSLEKIQDEVDRFIVFAKNNPELIFNVTRIGCGLAGYKDDQIAPMFRDAPDNCELPSGWRTIVEMGRNKE